MQVTPKTARKFIPILLTLAFFATVAIAENIVEHAELPPAFRVLQYHEVKSNEVATRSVDPIAIEHFEIPLEAVDVSMAKRIPPSVAASLIFTKNNRQYLRWIINPEDTKWHKQVEGYLRSHGIPVVKGKYFTAYQTASRSYFLVDPVTKATFSAKVSTDKTGGHWTDKKQTWEDAKQVRLAYEYVNDAIKKRGGLENGILIDEPAAFGLRSIDQGMLIRTYDVLAKGDIRLVPGFSVLHEGFGRDLANANGSKNPADFWNQNYNRPLARALAELYAISGMQFDSPHSQNFLVELDKSGVKPTGRIALRDFGDAFLTADALEAAKRPDIARKWERGNVKTSNMHVAVGLLHGNESPNWINKKTYELYGVQFFAEFEKEFLRITGVNLANNNGVTRSGLYYSKDYSTRSKEGQEYLKWLSDGRPKVQTRCRVIFQNAI